MSPHFIRVQDCIFDAGEFIKFWVEGPKPSPTDPSPREWVIFGTLRGQEKGTLIGKFKDHELAASALTGIHTALTKYQVEKVAVRL